ncbi:uncharacterized protein [Lepeophtheirus salmonis]|uniref:uncharacterized protein n=1 Tax=Lepeophtheirus salmonis TaxID=72036 RepID=UPI003AF3479A
MNHSPDTDELMTMSLPNNITGTMTTTNTVPPDEGKESSSSSSSSSFPPPTCSDQTMATTENVNASTTMTASTLPKKDPSSSPNSSSPPSPNELESGLRILENRLNKIAAPLAPSHLPKPTKSLLPKPDLKLKCNKSVKLMNIPSPISEIGPPSNSSSGNTTNAGHSATAPTTSSMLKSTLKRMTRFSTTKPSSVPPSNTHEPFISATSPKKRIAKSPAPPTTLGRSKSFKEPFSHRPSSSSSTSSTTSNGSSSKTMSSSLRRPARRDDSNNIQRSGTSGNLAKRSQSMRRLKDKDLCVKKSRGVQTQLTKDVMDEGVSSKEDESIPTAVDFSIYLPDILGCGNSVDPVETIVSEHSDPPDVRKNRQLTLDNMKLHREVERLKAQVNENEHLKKELKSVRIKLEEEVKARVHIEKQLDEHNDKVQCIVRSMDTVEREFECRQDNMLQLEQRCAEMQSQLFEAQRTINEKRQELSRKCNDYKALMSRFQEAEIETTELQEFLQAEKTTLTEALKESETDILEMKQKFIDKERELASAEERCQHLVRLGEQRHQEILTLETQLNGVQEKAKEMILSQGAEISRASIAFSQLSAKLEAFFNNFTNNNHFNHQHLSQNGFKTTGLFPRQGSSFDEDDENSCSPPSSSNLSSPLRKNSINIPRSASHFLVTPPDKDFEDDEELGDPFNKAMMNVSLLGPSATGSSNSINNNECLSNNNLCNINNNNNNNNKRDSNETTNAATDGVSNSLQNLSNAIDTRKKSQETGGLSENSDISSSSSSLPSLVDRIGYITNLIDKYNLNLRNISNCNCDRSTDIKELDPLATSTTADIINENQTNGNNNQDLNRILLEKENEIKELKKASERILKHREILQSNWKDTEAEIHEMDNLYQVTVENVLNVLQSHPDIVNANHDFLRLQKKMESVADSSSSIAVKRENGQKGVEEEDKYGLRSGGSEATPSLSLNNTSQTLKKPNGGLSNVKSSLTLNPEDDLNANQSL